MFDKHLNQPPETSKVSRGAPKPRLRVTIKQVEAEPVPERQRKALRLLCRGMIRLYIEEQKKNSNHGKGLDVL